MTNTDTGRAFDSFRALNSEAGPDERDQLFRNMAQLFSFVSDRCEDSQVEQYDEVLCQLADLVELEARTEVAKLLAPLQRAPGTAVVKLANDEIEVAKPLLEFSNVLSDDDLIEIVNRRGEEHRVAIAGREEVTARVGTAIIDQGEEASVGRLAANEGAEIADESLTTLIEKAADSGAIAEKLESRKDIDWSCLHAKMSDAGGKVLQRLVNAQNVANAETIKQASQMAFNRVQSRVGFSGREWGIAWGQVKALSDRRQLEARALERFARFGYGHHLGAAMTLLLGLKQEVFVKWLATNDHRALAVAAKTLGISTELFGRAIDILPWRDAASEAEVAVANRAFELMDTVQAENAFDNWRAQGFRGSSLSLEVHNMMQPSDHSAPVALRA